MMALYPQEKFILIQWMGEHSSNRPIEAELAVPVEYSGQRVGRWLLGVLCA